MAAEGWHEQDTVELLSCFAADNTSDVAKYAREVLESLS